MFIEQNLILIFSLFSLGLFGGFSHCVGMCGPFVMTQVGNRLQNIKIAEVTELKKLVGLALLPYHLGRITTYSFLGGLISFFSATWRETHFFKLISATFLIAAGLIFLTLALTKIKLPFKFVGLKIAPPFFLKNLLRFLFNKPTGWNGYWLGILLGFIPCGLLYGAFLLSAAIGNFFLAALGMAIFGLATIPALFLTACGSYWFLDKLPSPKSWLKLFTATILLLNAITVFVLAFGLIFDRV